MAFDFLTGAIPRIEAKAEHLALASTASDIQSVMLNYSGVERMARKEMSFPNVPLVLTSTIPDEELEEWFPLRELNLAERASASAVIPCDRPVYKTEPRSRRTETVRSYVADLREVTPRFRELGVEVVPLVKGETEYERGLCYDLFDDLDCPMVAYYCTQYFTYGYRFNELLRRLQQISVEYDPTDMMLIGLQSENLLPETPPCVSSAAGMRWLWNSNPRNVSLDVAASEYDQWSKTVESALQTSQTPVQAFCTDRGWA